MASAVLSLRFLRDYSSVTVTVSTNPDLSSPIVVTSPVPTAEQTVKIEVNGLNSDTLYYYGVSVEGVMLNKGKGSFKTVPATNTNFTVAFSSCCDTAYNAPVFDTLRALNPDLFIHMGDFHYLDISDTDIHHYRMAYDMVFRAERQANLYRSIPVAYVWDDHDFCGNDSDSESTGRATVTQFYRERVPHYPLAFPTGAISQTFVIGRVRFIITDLRYFRSPTATLDGPGKTMMGTDQLQWFYNQLLMPEPFKIWVSSMPWSGVPEEDTDRWCSYHYERTEIANFIKANKLTGKVMVISGDMHGAAIDPGHNVDYATDGGAALPNVQGAPLYQSASVKGGPWAYGPYLNGDLGHQFGTVQINDNGGSTIQVTMSVYRVNSVLASHSFNVNTAPVDTIPPAIPTGLSVSTGNSGELMLTWNPNQDLDLASYKLYMDGVLQLTVNKFTTSHLFTGLVDGQSYNFTVSAVDVSDNESAQSPPVQGTPEAPPAGIYLKDTFNRADTIVGGVGVAETGQQWVDNGEKYAIRNNQVVTPEATSSTSNQLVAETGQSDGVWEFTIGQMPAAGQYFRFNLRRVDGDNYVCAELDEDSFEVYYRRNGIFESNIVDTSVTYANGAILRVVMNGPTMDFYLDDVSLGSIQCDPAFISNTIHGFAISSSANSTSIDEVLFTALP